MMKFPAQTTIPSSSFKTLSWCLFFLLYLQVLQAIKSENYDFDILDFELSDIFDTQLLPAQVLSQPQKWFSKKHFPPINAKPTLTKNHTDIDRAFKAMTFHRHMMNEFLATNYLAQQILQGEASFDTSEQSVKAFGGIEKRIGDTRNITHAVPESHFTKSNHSLSNHKLPSEQDIKKYTSWLQRTATLDDIYKNLERNTTMSMPRKANYHGTHNRRLLLDVDDESTESERQYLDEGDVTGYAMPQFIDHHHQSSIPTLVSVASPSKPKLEYPYVLPINKNGYVSDFEAYGTYGTPPQQHARSEQNYQQPPTASKDIKEIGVKDITEIALTTLAFLSFGMFILQVLMCITMGKDDTSSMMMLPMESTDPSEIPGDGVEEIRRMRRSLTNKSDRLVTMNELARRAVTSIDFLLHDWQDDGNCYYWSLCENNRQTNAQVQGEKIWMPIWSVGLSWLATRVRNGIPNSTNGYMPTLQSLNAIIVGINNGNCNIYKSRCSKKKGSNANEATQNATSHNLSPELLKDNSKIDL